MEKRPTDNSVLIWVRHGLVQSIQMHENIAVFAAARSPAYSLEDATIFVAIKPSNSQNLRQHVASGFIRPPPATKTSGSEFVTDIWHAEQAKKSGVDIFGFLLLSGFGPDPKLIVEYVSSHLVKKVLDSTYLEQLIERISAQQTITGTGSSWSRRRELDEQISQLVKEAFKQTDDEAYEWILARILTSGTGEDRRSRDWLASGCSAIFAMLIGSQLFVANCGSQMAIICKDGTDGLSVISLTECQDRNSHCFGNYERKTAANSQPTCSAQPLVQPKIELDHNIRFLLLASSSVWPLFQQICPSNQSLDGAVANAIANAIYGNPNDDGQSAEDRLRFLLTNLLQKSSTSTDAESISLALVDLRYDIFPKMDFDEPEEEEEEGVNDADEEEEEDDDEDAPEGAVKSAVDWSEFETHHLKEEVLAKVDSLRQLYGQRRNLDSIREDF